VIDEPDFFEHPQVTTNDQAIRFVGDQGRAKGAAYFSRLEGQVYDDGIVYFTSTQGGGTEEAGVANPAGYGRGSGQVWGYDTRRNTLSVVYQSPDRQTLDFPDNVTTSPRGTLVLCEDNSDLNYLRGLSQDGRLSDIALNQLKSATGADRSGEEFAGSTFSTDGKTLFVNIQASSGLSFAIWGPWRAIGV
jgi:secreted PhoX family phosphatase